MLGLLRGLFVLWPITEPLDQSQKFFIFRSFLISLTIISTRNRLSTLSPAHGICCGPYEIYPAETCDCVISREVLLHCLAVNDKAGVCPFSFYNISKVKAPPTHQKSTPFCTCKALTSCLELVTYSVDVVVIIQEWTSTSLSFRCYEIRFVDG